MGFVLNRNNKASLEDSTLIEGFLSVWGFSGELWLFVVATGGCGWWRRILGRWKWFWKKEGVGNDIFPRLHEIQRLKHSSASALGQRSVSHTPEDILQIAMVRSRKSVTWTSRPIFKKIQRLTNSGRHVYQEGFRQFPWEASLRGFLEKLPREASLGSFLERLLWEVNALTTNTLLITKLTSLKIKHG